jgi:hypothetical protein
LSFATEAEGGPRNRQSKLTLLLPRRRLSPRKQEVRPPPRAYSATDSDSRAFRRACTTKHSARGRSDHGSSTFSAHFRVVAHLPLLPRTSTVQQRMTRRSKLSSFPRRQELVATQVRFPFFNLLSSRTHRILLHSQHPPLLEIPFYSVHPRHQPRSRRRLLHRRLEDRLPSSRRRRGPRASASASQGRAGGEDGEYWDQRMDLKTGAERGRRVEVEREGKCWRRSVGEQAGSRSALSNLFSCFCPPPSLPNSPFLAGPLFLSPFVLLSCRFDFSISPRRSRSKHLPAPSPLSPRSRSSPLPPSPHFYHQRSLFTQLRLSPARFSIVESFDFTTRFQRQQAQH